MVKSVSKILIVRYSSMGDVILVAPLIALLRKRYPTSAIVLLTQITYAPIFNDDRRFSRVIGVTKGELSSELEAYGTWDIVIDLQNSRRSRKQLELLAYTTLYCFNKMHLQRNVLLMFRTNTYDKEVDIAQRYLLSSGETPPFGDVDFSIPFKKNAAESFMPLIRSGRIERPIIALFPFSAWKNKEWPIDYFVSVGHYFLIKGWSVILFGGKADRERADTLQRKIGYRCVSLAGRFDLYRCGAVIKNCNLALGCDTGLSHLARACGVKCGFIFGPTTHHFGFQPLNDPNCAVFETKRFCRPCHPHGGNICMHLDHGCMKKIVPDTVIRGLLELYHG